MSQTISRIRSGSLADAGRLKKYIMVRKGKALLVRALRHLEEENMKVCILIRDRLSLRWVFVSAVHLQLQIFFILFQIFCNTLFPVLALAARKDRDDQLLGLLWDRGLGHYLNSPIAKTYDLSYGFLSLICTGSQGSLTISSNRASSKSPPPDSTKSSKFSILYFGGV